MFYDYSMFYLTSMFYYVLDPYVLCERDIYNDAIFRPIGVKHGNENEDHFLTAQ